MTITPAITSRPVDTQRAPKPHPLGEAKLLAEDGSTTRWLPIEPLKNSAARTYSGSLPGAVRTANSMARAITDNVITRRFNWQPSVAVVDAGNGVFDLFATQASVHPYNPIDSSPYVTAQVRRPENSPLKALVSFNHIADVSQSTDAKSQKLIRIPGTSIIVGRR